MMPSPRSEIQIPDHDVLRKIGGGAYGEVWMARGVTGALRAVKIVWREDFEDERGFEREFEGILKFEPISRDHPGFVNILHVGRGSESDSPFYYYVMELGDDIHSGREINPVEYEARTLRSDLNTSSGKPLDAEFCLDVGAKLSEALKHLHELDLAHRDIKPANVIFVDGKAKLADIGLVAARGQQTFVGTEGFVPPEGPGSGQADVYSLGKVLYEMATGKDRLQFPELPDSLPDGSSRKQWLALNRVICAVCEPRLKQRSISTAKQLSDAIAQIQQGKKIRDKRLLSTKRWVMIVSVITVIAFALFYYQPWSFNRFISSKAPLAGVTKYEHAMCSVQFITNPLQAKVSINGIKTGEETPTVFRQYAPGTKVLYTFEKPGYRALEKEYVIPDKEYYVFPTEHLSIFLPPKENEEWVDAQGVRYFPRVGFHESGYVRESNYQQFLATKPEVDPHQIESYSERGKPIKLVMMSKKSADAYARWVEVQAKEKGLLHEDQCVTAQQNLSLALGPADLLEARREQNLFATVLVAKEIPYAIVELKSDPAGARVFIDGEWRGVTPMETQKKIRPGEVEIVLRKDGYKAHTEIIELSDNEVRKYFTKLKQNNGVVMIPDWEKGRASHKWKNGAGVDMIQFDVNKMVSAWEVRVKDYVDFTRNTGHQAAKSPGFSQTPNHPIVGVSKNDAMAYCKWLTERERKQDRIGPSHEYRLPTDVEWSQLAGLPKEKGNTPAERHLQAQLDTRMKNRYPWGAVFPPRKKVANLADVSAARASGVRQDRVISEYNDGFVNTAAVGSLLPNKQGIYDLSGNVYEWVLDDYNTNEELNVARGGSWASYSPRNLKSWSRFPTQKEYRDNLYGFRYVLVDTEE